MHATTPRWQHQRLEVNSIPEKICKSCGRPFEWRKKWERDWDQVVYCSQKCKSEKVPEKYKLKIIEALESQTPKSSICPSQILSDANKKNKLLMERVRSAARILVHEGKIEITQKGKTVDPANFKGPIRLKLKL